MIAHNMYFYCVLFPDSFQVLCSSFFLFVFFKQRTVM